MPDKAESLGLKLTGVGMISLLLSFYLYLSLDFSHWAAIEAALLFMIGLPFTIIIVFWLTEFFLKITITRERARLFYRIVFCLCAVVLVYVGDLVFIEQRAVKWKSLSSFDGDFTGAVVLVYTAALGWSGLATVILCWKLLVLGIRQKEVRNVVIPLIIMLVLAALTLLAKEYPRPHFAEGAY